MKFSGKSHHPPVGVTSKNYIPSPDSDLQPPKPFQRRKPRTPGTRLRKYGAPSSGKRRRPETPLLKWKIHDKNDDDPHEEDQKSSEVRVCRRTCRNLKKQTDVAISARRLAAGLWRMHLPEITADSRKRLGFQNGSGHVGLPFVGRPNGMTRDSNLKNLSQSPRSIFGTKSGHNCEWIFEFQLHLVNRALQHIQGHNISAASAPVLHCKVLLLRVLSQQNRSNLDLVAFAKSSRDLQGLTEDDASILK